MIELAVARPKSLWPWNSSSAPVSSRSTWKRRGRPQGSAAEGWGVAAAEELVERPGVALLVDEGLDGVDGAGAVVELVEQVEVADARVVGEEGDAAVLGAVAQGGVGDQLRQVI